MRNIFYKFQDLIDNGADSYGMLWYLGFILLSSTFLLGILMVITNFFPPIIMITSIPFLAEIIMLLISVFGINWLETKIVTLKELKVVLIIEGVLSLLLLGVGIISVLINIICIMSIISFIVYLVERYA